MALLLECLLHLIRKRLSLLEHTWAGYHAPGTHCEQVNQDEDVDEGLDGRVHASQEVVRG